MNFQWLFDRPIAHRGLHNDIYPENSMPAYQLAIDNNFNIEIDVHVTKDKHIVVFHDNNLKRMCGVNKLVKNCTLEELKSYRLAGTEYTIPTLEEFLNLVDGKVGILCEIKGTNPFDFSIIAPTCKALKDYKGNIALQSFNFTSVIYARRHTNLPCGELCTWCSPDGKNPRWHFTDFMGKLWICLLSKPHFIAYDARAIAPNLSPNKWLAKWGEKLPTIVWTVNSEERMESAKKYASNIIFEKLDVDYVNSTVGTYMPFKCPKDKMPNND